MKLFIYRDKQREYRWRLKARNGRIIADSGEGYLRKSDCVNAIRKLRTGALTADVVDTTA